MKKGYKVFFAILGVVLVVSLISITLSSGKNPFLTKAQKDKIIARTLVEDGKDAAIDKVIKYYGSSSDYALIWAMAINENTKDKRSKSDNDLSLKFLDVDHSDNYITFKYKITNDGKESFSFVKAKVSLLDESKNVITSDWTYAVGSEGIDPGASQEFDIMIDRPKSGEVSSFKISIIDYN